MATRDSTSLCASCDRCRARKTRCDGQRPCSACKQKYMKRHKLTNVDGVDEARFECFYSPAKRRGPVPGHKQYKDNGLMMGGGGGGAGGSVCGSVVGGGGGSVGGGSAATTITKSSKKHVNPIQQSQNSNNGGVGVGVGGLTLEGLLAGVGGGGFIGVNGATNISGMSMNTMTMNNSMGNSQHGGNASSVNSGGSGVNNFGTGGGGGSGVGNANFPLLPPLDPSAAAMQQHVLSTLGSIGLNMFASAFSNNSNNNNNNNNGRSGGSGSGGGGTGGRRTSVSPPSAPIGGGGRGQDTMASAQNAAQQQLAYVQQLQLQQQIQAQQQRRDMNAVALGNMQAVQVVDGVATMNTMNAMNMNNQAQAAAIAVSNASAAAAAVVSNGAIMGGGTSRRRQLSPLPAQQQTAQINNVETTHTNSSKPQVIGCTSPQVKRYLPLISPANPHGSHLRACHTLSMGGLFALPPIPTDEEYCRRFDKSLEPHQLPKFDVAALQAGRFAELAMGALSDTKADSNTKGGRNGLLLGLVNASVLCLRDCVEERVHPSLMFDVARAYFFHAIARAQLDDDMERYFKYRRVCLRYLSQLDGYPGVDTLMAAISFQDSLTYMLFNASEDDLPTVDTEIPRVSPPHPLEGLKATDAEKKYGISFSPSRVASNPLNQYWIQGAPPVWINESSPPKSRVLDALACAVRFSLDGAKSSRVKEGPTQSSRGRIISRKRKFLSDAEGTKEKSATEWAVEHHPNELSCTNLLAKACALLKNDEDDATASSSSLGDYCNFGSGHRLLLSALDILIINTERVGEDENVSQIHNIIAVLEGIMERPILLFQGGPTYHIMTNCAIFLAHIINKLHADGVENNEFAKAQYEVALNVYNGSRLVLEKHRSKIPSQLQCHEVPIPNTGAKSSSREVVIDLNSMALCPSRNCQDCIARGSMSAKEMAKRVVVVSTNSNGKNGQQKSDAEREFDVNDRGLLGVLSRMIGSLEEKV